MPIQQKQTLMGGYMLVQLALQLLQVTVNQQKMNSLNGDTYF